MPAFALVALLVTLTPGPGTAMILRVAARDGRRAGFEALLGNEIGILVWGNLSAVGISSLILASNVAYDLLRLLSAVLLVTLGVRSILRRRTTNPDTDPEPELPSRHSGLATGVVTSLANPKLAVFFIALFPQFLRPHAHVLPAALLMAGIIVLFDLIWFTVLITALSRAQIVFRRSLRQRMEKVTGAVLVGLGLRLVLQLR